MGTRMQEITPFHRGQATAGQGEKSERVKVEFKKAGMRNIGQPDPLRQALVAPPRELDDTKKFMKRPVQAKGHQYMPKWQPLTGRSGISGTSATSMKSHTSRPGDNAVGHNSNRTGQKSGYPSFRPSGGGRKP